MTKLSNDVDDLFGEGTTIEHVKNTSKNIKKPGAFSKFIQTTSGRVLLTTVALGAIFSGTVLYNSASTHSLMEINNTTTEISSFQDSLTPAQRAILQEKMKIGADRQEGAYKSQDGKFNLKDSKAHDIPVSMDSIKTIKKTYINDSNILSGIEKVTGFEVPKNLKNNQVGAWVIKETVGRNDFAQNTDAMLLATTFHREGFVSHVYNDVGYASVGPGQTVGVQGSASVKSRFSSIGIDGERLNYFTSLSGKKLAAVQLPSNYKDITITGEEGAKLSLLQIHKDFIPSVQGSIGKKAYDTILPQQRVALVNLAYQKGNIGQTLSGLVKNHVDFVEKNPNASKEQRINHWKKNVSPAYLMMITVTIPDTTDKKKNVKIKVNDERSVSWARTISDDFETATKILNKTITPKEAKEYNIKMEQIYGQSKENKAPVISINPQGDVEFNDPMKEYREKAKTGEVSFTVDKEIKPEAPKAQSKKTFTLRY